MRMNAPLSEYCLCEWADRRRFLQATVAGTGLALLVRETPITALAKSRESSGSPKPMHGQTGVLMATAGEIFLNSLNLDQRNAAVFNFEDDERQDWHFVPKPRKGIPLKHLDSSQRQLASALLNTGLSQSGYTKASSIISLEPVLNEIEQGRGPARDPELYYFSVFGAPRSSKPWGWRVEGHHLSLNFTVVNQDFITSTPCFFGANPAEVMHGPRVGLRTLPSEEDLARTFLKSLDAGLRTQAVISDRAPEDILSGHSRKANPLKPAGLSASRLGGRQTEILMRLLSEYAGNMPSEIAAKRIGKLRSAGLNSIYFAWAGGSEHGQAHYYRIQGPTFLVEYDNIQNNANHIHSVWRDFNGDFGVDMLAEHYKSAHR
jgi:hypothetical protein